MYFSLQQPCPRRNPFHFSEWIYLIQTGEKSTINETRWEENVHKWNRIEQFRKGKAKKQLPKANGTNRMFHSSHSSLSAFTVYFFFYKLLAAQVHTKKPRQIRENRFSTHTKPNETKLKKTRRWKRNEKGERKKIGCVYIESGNKRLNRFIWL